MRWQRVSYGWCEAGCYQRRARWAGPLTYCGGNLWCGTCRREYEREQAAKSQLKKPREVS